MQVFDGAAYDRRYEETFAPAIQNGGAVPLRADKILGTKPVIEKIEAALRGATIAFAEISEDNPNVFTELGYALDQQIPLIMVCDRAKRQSLPFDISHRPVLFYKAESQGDFEKLSREIEGAVAAAIIEAAEKQAKPKVVAFRDGGGVEPDGLKNRILLEILESEIGDPTGLSAYRIVNGASKVGFSEGLTSLAILSLMHDELITSDTAEDYNHEPYTAYKLSDAGKALLLSRYAEIKNTEEAAARAKQIARPVPAAFDADLDDDVPF
jgi:hypothetical protein